jgi:hypothetical protein
VFAKREKQDYDVVADCDGARLALYATRSPLFVDGGVHPNTAFQEVDPIPLKPGHLSETEAGASNRRVWPSMLPQL